MTTLVIRDVSVPLPALLIAVFTLGMLIGIPAGVAAYSYGASISQEKARIERETNPINARGICPPDLPPAR